MATKQNPSEDFQEFTDQSDEREEKTAFVDFFEMSKSQEVVEKETGSEEREERTAFVNFSEISEAQEVPVEGTPSGKKEETETDNAVRSSSFIELKKEFFNENWTIQEKHNGVYLENIKSGKVFKLLLEEDLAALEEVIEKQELKITFLEAKLEILAALCHDIVSTFCQCKELP